MNYLSFGLWLAGFEIHEGTSLSRMLYNHPKAEKIMTYNTWNTYLKKMPIARLVQKQEF